jgi:pseudouridine-5'-phosphate glycosidase
VLNQPAPLSSAIVFSSEVSNARLSGRPLVALESSVLAQGLPLPANRDAAVRMAAAVRAMGAVPAVTAVVRGVPTIGLEDADLERFLAGTGVAKVSARDLPWAMATGADGATTVAASLALCTLAGIEVFATGGIGGVHRNAHYDESADLSELARAPVVTVCAGAKSFLDVGATLERLETLGVSVLGYRTDEFPGFLALSTGFRVPARAESATAIARAYRALSALRRPAGLLVVQPPPDGVALGGAAVDQAVDLALARAREAGVTGAAVTPWLLAALAQATGGRTLATNVALLESNAALAGEIAVALAQQP